MGEEPGFVQPVILHRKVKQMALTHRALDFHDDGGAFLRTIEVPNFVKEASGEAPQRSNEYAVVLVDGDAGFPKFATSSPGLTWVSGQYYAEVADLLPTEVARVAAHHIKQASVAFDVPVPAVVDMYAEGPVPISNMVDVTGMDVAEKLASRDVENWALPSRQQYPLDTREDAQQAVAYFEQFVNELDLEDRRTFAEKTASALTEHGLLVPQSIRDYTGTAISPMLPVWLDVRADLVKEAGALEEKLADLYARAYEADNVMDAVAYVAAFDKLAGLEPHWNGRVPDPWVTVVGVIDEVDCVPVDTPAGYLDPAALHKVASDMRGVASLLGADVALQMAQDPLGTFQKLSEPQQYLLARVAGR
jgi:hypothetical protein